MARGDGVGGVPVGQVGLAVERLDRGRAEQRREQVGVGIRLADTDGNPDAAPVSGWTSRTRTVGGSPEYNSGTSAFAGAASAVIEGFYCRAKLAFSFETDSASNGARFYRHRHRVASLPRR